MKLSKRVILPIHLKLANDNTYLLILFLNICVSSGAEMRDKIRERLEMLNRKYSHYGEIHDFSKEGSTDEVNIPWNAAKLITLERDEYKCRICGNSPIASEDKEGFNRLRVEVEVHHIIPRIAGGTDSTENLITLCKACHIKTFKNNYSGLPSVATRLDERVEILTNSPLLLSHGSNCRNRFLDSFYFRDKEITLKESLDCKICEYSSLKKIYDLIFLYDLDTEEIVIKDENKEFCVGIIEK
jgi:hypothetical protein